MKIRRRHVLIYVVIITIVCLVIVTLSFDKYARNDSINNYNRPVIEKYLSNEDKKFLIDNTIDADLFIRFIKEPDFNIKNYEYYQLIENSYPKMSPEEVVKKTNELVENKFTLKYLKSVVLKHEYEVDELLELAQLSTKSNDLIAEFNPDANLALANDKYYISHYIPSDLVKIDNKFTDDKKIYLRKPANEALTKLCYKLQMLDSSPCGDLTVQYGYISYDDASHIKDAGYSLVPGHNSFQLGTTIQFKEKSGFLNSEWYLWLLENANKFGFILRFPQGKQDITGVASQPLIFTYVGDSIAKELYSSQQTIEEKRGD